MLLTGRFPQETAHSVDASLSFTFGILERVGEHDSGSKARFRRGQKPRMYILATGAGFKIIFSKNDM